MTLTEAFAELQDPRTGPAQRHDCSSTRFRFSERVRSFASRCTRTGHQSTPVHFPVEFTCHGQGNAVLRLVYHVLG
jgi:hypothetical protein